MGGVEILEEINTVIKTNACFNRCRGNNYKGIWLP